MDSLRDLQKSLWKCNKCGSCTSVCPLYAQTKDEALSARGRLAVIDALLDGGLAPGKSYEECLYNCILCQACSANCASGVPTTEIFLAARSALTRERKQPLAQRLFFRGLLARPDRLKLGVSALCLCQKTGLHRLAGSGVVSRLLPLSVRRARDFLFDAPLSGFRVKDIPKADHPRGCVAYFPGCAVSALMPQVCRSTCRLLALSGWDVVLPENYCCGMPHLVHGDEETARRLARKNITLYRDVEVVVTDCATCGAALKGYEKLLSGDSGYGEMARLFSAKVRDLTEFLAGTGVSLPAAAGAAPTGSAPRAPGPDGAVFGRPPSAGYAAAGLTPGGVDSSHFHTSAGEVHRVTYHDPCHLARGQGVRRQPRQLLKAIPGVKLVEMENPDACCGGGGSFLFTHPGLAEKVGGAKARAILNTGAGVVVTECPGCVKQIKLSLQRESGGARVKVVHLAEFLGSGFTL
ncbi:MAG: (Fe-S)-binding protein [Eubacteriales bacterium]